MTETEFIGLPEIPSADKCKYIFGEVTRFGNYSYCGKPVYNINAKIGGCFCQTHYFECVLTKESREAYKTEKTRQMAQLQKANSEFISQLRGL